MAVVMLGGGGEVGLGGRGADDDEAGAIVPRGLGFKLEYIGD